MKRKMLFVGLVFTFCSFCPMLAQASSNMQILENQTVYSYERLDSAIARAEELEKIPEQDLQALLKAYQHVAALFVAAGEYEKAWPYWEKIIQILEQQEPQDLEALEYAYGQGLNFAWVKFMNVGRQWNGLQKKTQNLWTSPFYAAN